MYWSRVAKDAGYVIDWSEIVGNENDVASKLAAEQMDTSKLEAMFQRIVTAMND